MSLSADSTRARCRTRRNHQRPHVSGLLQDISGVGRDSTRGGYSRPVFSTAETDLRAWFIEQAGRRGLDVQTDSQRDHLGLVGHGNGGCGRTPSSPAATSTPFPAAARTTDRSGSRRRWSPSTSSRPATSGPGGPWHSRSSRRRKAPGSASPAWARGCSPGNWTPTKARNLKDPDGNTYAEVAAANGQDPRFIGADYKALQQLGMFVELHVEQGRGLIDLNQPVAIGSSILGHGRWKLSIAGEGNHAGTTLMKDRKDPMIAAAKVMVSIRDTARKYRDARATVGRVQPVPGGTNVIASRVDLWIDVRHPEDSVTAALVESIGLNAQVLAAEEGCTASLGTESLSPTVHFDGGLRDRLQELLPAAPVLDTGAGHDAGVLAAHLPTAMLFVRNPTGVSHSPDELVEDWDAEAGALALADSLAGLLGEARVIG